MLRTKQRLSAAFSARQSSHTSDEQTVVGSPVQLLDSAVVMYGIQTGLLHSLLAYHVGYRSFNSPSLGDQSKGLDPR